MSQSDLLSTNPTNILPVSPVRVASIDVLRAATMVLMIFVNDLGSLTDVPVWLEHVPGGVDGMGLADSVFPAFLFIVGLSIPYAIDARRGFARRSVAGQKKGDFDVTLIGHIVSRSVALLVMGVFLVNGETINEGATGMQRVVWNMLSCTAFILLWNAYPKTVAKNSVWASKSVGVGILMVLVFIYRGGTENNLTHFAPQWWGILGLIGWSYLAAALVTVFAQNRLSILVLAWVGFALLSIADHAEILPNAVHFIPGAISGGTLAGLTMGGVIISTLFRAYRQRGENRRMTLVFLAISVVLIGLAVYTRQFWGISKLGATPAWLFLCSALTVLTFLLIYWLTDVAGKANWLAFIKPAGTDTLLCYLIPYFAYGIMTILDLHLPDAVLHGSLGLVKSFSFALLCVWITGQLNRKNVRLKL